MSKKLIYAGDQISLSEKQNLSVLLASVQEVLESGRGGWVEVRTNRGARHILVNSTTSLQVINEKSLVNATQNGYQGHSTDAALADTSIPAAIKETPHSSGGCSCSEHKNAPATSTPQTAQQAHTPQNNGQSNHSDSKPTPQDVQNNTATNPAQAQATPAQNTTVAAPNDTQNSPAPTNGDSSEGQNNSGNNSSPESSSSQDDAIPMPAAPDYADSQNDASKAPKPQVTNDKGMANTPSAH